jgi:hypothetical protein
MQISWLSDYDQISCMPDPMRLHALFICYGKMNNASFFVQEARKFFVAGLDQRKSFSILHIYNNYCYTAIAFVALPSPRLFVTGFCNVSRTHVSKLVVTARFGNHIIYSISKRLFSRLNQRVGSECYYRCIEP